MARPRLLSDAKKHEIVAMLACGCTFESAARYACCSVLTIRREARRNAEFHEQLRQALIRAQVTPVNVLHDYARRDWRAAAWLLERTDPGRFSKRAAKTFTETEVVELVGRIYDTVRRQIDNKETRLKIKRQVRTLVKSALNPATQAKLPSVALAAPAMTAPPHEKIEQETDREHAAKQVRQAKSGTAAPRQKSAQREPRARAAGQNGSKPAPVLIRAADVPSDRSSTFAPCDAT
jgi:hypothetical protein